MLGSGIDPIWGRPGIGTGTATELGVFVGKVSARPGTLNPAIERLEDLSMLPSGWRIAVAVEWNPERDNNVPIVKALALASPVAVTVPSSLWTTRDTAVSPDDEVPAIADASHTVLSLDERRPMPGRDTLDGGSPYDVLV
jgi:hypothetical protein